MGGEEAAAADGAVGTAVVQQQQWCERLVRVGLFECVERRWRVRLKRARLRMDCGGRRMVLD